MNIEMKFYEHNLRLTERVVSIIRKEDFADQCIITSMNYQELLKVKKLDNRIKTGIVIFEAIGKVYDLECRLFQHIQKEGNGVFYQ